jgi:deoxyribose-phosphate aldolase
MIHLQNYKKFVNEQLEGTESIQQPVQTEQSGQTQSEISSIQTETPKQIQIQLPKVISKYNGIIDFTCLKSNTTKENINELIKLANENKFYSICIPSEFVDYAKYIMEDTEVKIVSVLDFPDGDSTESEKLKETIRLISAGVDEIDMVMDYKALKKAYVETDNDVKESSYSQIEKKIRTISNECHKNGTTIKVIVESGELTLEELTKACEFVTSAGADFIQTSTGMSKIGAELNKVKEIRRLLPDHILIKVAGGIRNISQVEEYFPYIDRIGTSTILKDDTKK